MSDNGDINVTKHETIDERLLNRVIFFTDAVFAIVLTLMVLDLKPPTLDSPLHTTVLMWGMASHFFALTLSFLVIGVFWIAHLSTTRRLRQFDWAAAVANLIFMFPICLLPFSTAWWGQEMDAALPWGMYCATMMACSLANLGLVLTVSRDGGRLVGGMTRRERLYRAVRAASPGIAFGLGIVLMAMGHLRLAQFSWVLIPVQILIYDRTIKPKAAKKAS